MFHRACIAFVACIVALSGCERPVSPTAPLAPQSGSFDKQSTRGSQLLLTALDEVHLQWDVYRVDDDGTNLIGLTGVGSGERDPAWAPDGKGIVFAGHVFTPSEHAIYLMAGDGTGMTRLTTPTISDDESPVGFSKGVVFARTGSPEAGIYLIGPDGGATQLTSGVDDQPAPSPKGKSMAFRRGGDVHVLDLVTGGITDITNHWRLCSGHECRWNKCQPADPGAGSRQILGQRLGEILTNRRGASGSSRL